MIVICEQCNARYLVATLMLGETGRNVRCGVCGHTWYQEPIPETEDAPASGSFKDHLDQQLLEPIPEGVKPLPEDATVTVARRKSGVKIAINRNEVIGGALAAAVCGVILGGLVLLRQPMVYAWPPSAHLYEAMGFTTPPAPGAGLAFEDVVASAKTDDHGKAVLNIAGTVVNTTHAEVSVPAMEGIAGEIHFMIPADHKTLGPEEKFSFTATHEGLPADVKEIAVGFAGAAAASAEEHEKPSELAH